MPTFKTNVYVTHGSSYSDNIFGSFCVVIVDVT